jgi:thymidylate kinase
LSERGRLIAFSGVDCAGKSTQRELLLEALRAAGTAPITVYTRPGYTPGLRALKGVLPALLGRKRGARAGVSDVPSRFPRRAANLPNPLVRWLWVTSALLDLLLLYGVRVRLWRARGRTVVCNRYLLDALVDLRVNFPGERVERRWLCRWLRRSAARPDAAFCLLIPAEETMARARAKKRFHWETLDVLRERWREYGVLADELGVQILDGARPVEELARSIRERVAGAPSAQGGGPVAQPLEFDPWPVRAQRQE